MRLTFHAFGHPNVTGRHKTTLEFTKDMHMGIEADCIIGTNADFDSAKAKAFIHYCKEHHIEKAKAIISVGDESDSVFFLLNMDFCDEKEMVIRMGRFLSPRTLGVDATKGAMHLKRELIEKIKEPGQEITISITAV
ncbi:DUF371 domain-containing protein [Candidatus Woesearchaeota archaeon]|nr:DUF371 domain-containing protein [Candidatus Woesearchaeota archaeon]